MKKQFLIIGIIILSAFAQDTLLDSFNNAPGTGSDVPSDADTNTSDLILDTSLPLSDNFDAEEEIHGTPLVQEGEVSAQEHVDATIQGFWGDNLFTFNTFDDFYTYLLQFVNGAIETETGYRNDQFTRCEGFTADKEALERDIERTESFINWILARLAANDAKVEEIFDGRCKTHMNYLNFMKNSQITLRLLDFLRQALENYSFIQMKHVGQILQKYRDTKLSNEEVLKVMLVELKDIENRVTVRNAEEIGTKHIDNDRDQLAIDGFSSSDRRDLELLNIIDQIEAELKGEIERRQNDEIELNEKVIEWTQNLEAENSELNRHLAEENATLQGLTDDLSTVLYESETCEAQLQWLNDELVALNEYLDYLINNRDAAAAQFQEERDKYVLSGTLVLNEPI